MVAPPDASRRKRAADGWPSMKPLRYRPAIAVGLARWPVVILRSFGKFYGLPDCGSASDRARIVECIGAALGPWPVPGRRVDRCGRRSAWATHARQAQLQARNWTSFCEGGVCDCRRHALLACPASPCVEAACALARQHIWCRSFEWADDLLRFGLPADAAGLDRLAAALKD